VPLDFYTCWIPLRSEAKLELIPSSHQIGGYATPLHENRLPAGYGDQRRSVAGDWHASTYSLGDVVLFNWRTIRANYGVDSAALAKASASAAAADSKTLAACSYELRVKLDCQQT
jgi:hypothetical protein